MSSSHSYVFFLPQVSQSVAFLRELCSNLQLSALLINALLANTCISLTVYLVTVYKGGEFLLSVPEWPSDSLHLSHSFIPELGPFLAVAVMLYHCPDSPKVEEKKVCPLTIPVLILAGPTSQFSVNIHTPSSIGCTATLHSCHFPLHRVHSFLISYPLSMYLVSILCSPFSPILVDGNWTQYTLPGLEVQEGTRGQCLQSPKEEMKTARDKIVRSALSKMPTRHNHFAK